MCVHLRAPRCRPAQLRVRLGKQRAQPGSWAGLCRHRVSDPASVSTMAGWPSSAVLLTPKEGKHESSRVGLSLPRPPWGDDRLSLGGVTRQSQSEVAGNAEASSFPGRNPSLCISQEKKKKKTKNKKNQGNSRRHGWQAARFPPTRLHRVLVFGITNLLRTGASVYKNSAGPATVLLPIL